MSTRHRLIRGQTLLPPTLLMAGLVLLAPHNPRIATGAEAVVNLSGLSLVTTVDQGIATSDVQNQAFSDAWVFAMKHPNDVGYPGSTEQPT